MRRVIKNVLRENYLARQIKANCSVLKLKTASCFNGTSKDIDFNIAAKKRTYYLAFFMEFLCNFKCSYCIQDTIKRNEYDRICIDEVIDYLKRVAIKKETFLAIIGGEVTINPNFKYFVESLCDTFCITVTTNLGSKFFKDFDEFLLWAEKNKIQWNTSYHPEYMDVDVFIERIKKMRKAGLDIGQVSSVDSGLLSADDIKKLNDSDIGFKKQIYFGPDPEPNGLLPKFYDHPDFNYTDYYKMCGKEYKKQCICKSTIRNGHARHLIAPDGKIYNCHHLLYAQKRPVGHIKDGWPKKLLKPFFCDEFGHCNPCDIFDMRVVSVK